MKTICLVIAASVASLLSYGQKDCGTQVNSTSSGAIQITIISETGECFKVSRTGETLTEEYASKVIFNHPMNGKVTLSMDNGESFVKNIMLNDTYQTASFKIKKNKKGKYAMRLMPANSTTTGPTAAEMVEANMKKMEEEKAERDREWDEARAKEKEERDARREAERKEYEEEVAAREAERKERWAADSEARKAEEKPRETLESTLPKEEKTTTTTSSSTMTTTTTTSSSSTSSSSTMETSASASSGTGSDGTYEKNNKVYFDSYSDGHQMDFYFTYDGKPVCNWDIEIGLTDREGDEVVVAMGTTDANGHFKSSYKGITDAPLKVSGARENVNWSADGFWYIDAKEYNGRKLEIDVKKYESYMAEMMGDSPLGGAAMSFASYGLTTGCK